MPVDFVSSEALIGAVQEELSSFDSAGLIDTGLFYRKIKKALNDLGLSATLPAEVILYPEHFKAQLPEDLVDWYALYRLKAQSPRTQRRILSDVQVYRETEQLCLQKTRCCELDVSGTFIREKIVREVGTEENHYHNIGLLEYVPRGPFRPGGLCHLKSPCRWFRSSHQFSDSAHYFHFNFQEDPVLLQYHAMPMEQGVPMVPSEPRVQHFLEKLLIYESLRKIYYNGEVNDLERRIQLAKSELDVAYADALNWAKTPSFKTLLAYSMQLHRQSVFTPYEYTYS